MATTHFNNNPLLPGLLKELGLTFEQFFLLDVGCSGGIDKSWFVFGDKLKAIGFDPLVAEIERLNRNNKHPGVAYVDGFVEGCEKKELLENEACFSNSGDAFCRSSAFKATQIKKYSYVEQVFNSGAPVRFSEKKFTLDDFIKDHPQAQIDFIKIDTDGHDIDVLLGSDKILQKGVLGISVEAQLHGSTDERSNTFANIDVFLRNKGFTLFDMSVFRYSRGVLPSAFTIDTYAQTVTGPVVWGEAVYFRDLVKEGYETAFPFSLTSQNILKLICLYEMFSLPDCAVEIILKYFNQFGWEEHKEILLNKLTPTYKGKQFSYKAYLERFERNPDSFFPGLGWFLGNQLPQFLNQKITGMNQRFKKFFQRI